MVSLLVEVDFVDVIITKVVEGAEEAEEEDEAAKGAAITILGGEEALVVA